MAKQKNKSLLVIGECMMELAGDGDYYHRAFAGDTYNSAVYAKRREPAFDVQILTAIGTDPISETMVAQWDRNGVGHTLVMRSATAHPGIYAISTDDAGERSFTYWRAASAATEFMSLMSSDIRKAIGLFDTVYFSGITLSILSDEDKADFLAMIAEVKSRGVTIAFDPNYRAILWRDASHATHWINQAYQLADIALPGLADHQDMYGHQNKEEVRSFLSDFGIEEILLKADAAGIFGYLNNEESVHLAINPEPNPVDTTGAGDSFAGTYLAERLLGNNMLDALRSADQVASLVINHRGAIIDADLYLDALPFNSTETR